MNGFHYGSKAMKKILLTLAATAALLVGTLATPSTAEAQRWVGRGYYGSGYRPYYGYGYGYGYRPYSYGYRPYSYSYRPSYYSYRPYYYGSYYYPSYG
jgi:hypothetical protein